MATSTPTTPSSSTTSTIGSMFKGIASKGAEVAKQTALEKLPEIVETGKQQVITASTTAMDKMTPTQVDLFARNLNDINTAVQTKAQTVKPVGSSRRHKNKKRTARRKRTHKLKQNRKH